MIPAVMKINKPSIVKEAMWLTSNVAAGNKNQIQAILDANLVPLVIEVMKKVKFSRVHHFFRTIFNFLLHFFLPLTIFFSK